MIFLKKFIASGFKSFATPIEINFSSNMAGIIGPNGSGKSNIVDAIK
jgi:chromosome segregation protein